MRWFVLLIALLMLVWGCVQVTQQQATKSEAQVQITEKTVPEQIEKPIQEGVEIMKLRSNDFKQGGMIPRKFTCQGEDINPHLAWSDVPAGTKSFALIVDDPDAPMGTWVHWLVKDIPANVKEIKQNSVPGNQVENDFGKEDYGGPCPPSGVHRYFFRLYALDVKSLDASDKGEVYRQVEEHAIAKAELMGKYSKS